MSLTDKWRFMTFIAAIYDIFHKRLVATVGRVIAVTRQLGRVKTAASADVFVGLPDVSQCAQSLLRSLQPRRIVPSESEISPICSLGSSSVL